MKLRERLNHEIAHVAGLASHYLDETNRASFELRLNKVIQQWPLSPEFFWCKVVPEPGKFAEACIQWSPYLESFLARDLI